MKKFLVFDYSFKIGFLLVILAFVVGFFGNKYHSVIFALAYYQYLYILVITFAGIQYGMMGGFFTSTFICILHVLGLNVNPAYYSTNSAPVHYNVQLIFFTLMGLISGFGYELMARQNLALNKSVAEMTKKLQSASSAPAANTGQQNELATAPVQRVDTSIKFYNFLLKFSKLIVTGKSADEIFEIFFKTLAVDYGVKEYALFMVAEKGRTLAGKFKKNLAHIENIEEVIINYGEGIIGKSAVNLQVILNDTASEKSNDWQMSIPLLAHGSLYAVVGIAKFRNIGLLSPDDVQYVHKVSEIVSTALENHIPKDIKGAFAVKKA
ncbi:MAG TPA: GAF domain-containing protein [Candidatus Wallbacteria bacterium]|nr:GAF domain-containing protein [Candidatus Wallbacteria bacterium]